MLLLYDTRKKTRKPESHGVIPTLALPLTASLDRWSSCGRDRGAQQQAAAEWRESSAHENGLE